MTTKKKAKKKTTIKGRIQEPYASAVAEAMKALASPPAASEKWGDEYLHELLDAYDEYAEWAEQDDKSKRPNLSSRIQALGRRIKEAENIAQVVAPRLKKDLHDAGNRIRQLELEARLNSHEVVAIHEALEAAGAPKTGTILERLRVVLARRIADRASTYRVNMGALGVVPLAGLDAMPVWAGSVSPGAWHFERSTDGGETWRRCDVRGEPVA